ncbi:hypothetical protein DFH06DRAFT_1204792 [Mycena polygramma]|nr:hypothetical protein DFH06DRAFT_1204792 [Mycena polygramma]
MTSVYGSARGDSVQNYVPTTVELDLGALEVEFDKQLAEVMDNLFGNEFAGLCALDPIATIPDTNTAVSSGNKQPIVSAPRFRENSVPSGSVYDAPVIPTATNAPLLGRPRSNADARQPMLRSTSSAAKTPTQLPSITPLTAPKNSTAAWGPTSKPVVPHQIRETIAPSGSAARGQLEHSRETTPLKNSVPQPSPHAPAACDPVETLGFSFNPTQQTSSSSPAAPATISSFSTIADQSPSSLLAPPPYTEICQSSYTGAVNEDIEMPFAGCSSPSEGLGGVSFQLRAPQNQTLIAENGMQQNTSPSLWTPTNQQASNSAFTARAWSEPGPIYPAQFLSDPNSAPHPSIFELMDNDRQIATSLISPYIVPPAPVPDHVWQEEIARSRHRAFNNPPKPSKRSKISAPYFFRTPLVLVKRPRDRKLKSEQSSLQESHLPGIYKTDDSRFEKARKPRERASSPAFSSSSDGSSISQASVAFSLNSTSTSHSYRRLSSPPPFGLRRQRLTASSDERRGVLSALMSMAWPWSR